jgi:hypothetical protein
MKQKLSRFLETILLLYVAILPKKARISTAIRAKIQINRSQQPIKQINLKLGTTIF